MTTITSACGASVPVIPRLGEKKPWVVRVSVDMDVGAGRFRAAVREASVREAMSMVANNYPEVNIRVVFRSTPRCSFLGGAAAVAMPIGIEMSDRSAA